MRTIATSVDVKNLATDSSVPFVERKEALLTILDNSFEYSYSVLNACKFWAFHVLEELKKSYIERAERSGFKLDYAGGGMVWWVKDLNDTIAGNEQLRITEQDSPMAPERISAPCTLTYEEILEDGQQGASWVRNYASVQLCLRYVDKDFIPPTVEMRGWTLVEV